MLRRVRTAAGAVPLRLRLVGAVLLLVLVALVGSAAAATATMRNYLVSRVDDQLSGVGGHAGDLSRQYIPAAPPPNSSTTSSHRLPSLFVSEVLGPAGHVLVPLTNDLIDEQEPLPNLPHLTAAQIESSGPRFFSVRAISGDESWRVYAQPVQFLDGRIGTLLVAQSLVDVDNTVTHLEELLAIIGAAALVIVAAVGYLIVRASLRPLRAVEATAAKIAGGDLSHRVPQPDPRTEVGHLAGALNTMLAKIESAFAERAASEERMRRFVADASHELRTPLTTVRGFAELYRQGAVTDAEGTRRLVGRIEDEAKRMGVLVEDLLMLARLDEERPLAQEPVDVLALASAAVRDAQVLAPARPIPLEVGPVEPPPIVVGDEPRLRQVLSNLLTNALKYTPPDSPVTVSVMTTVDDHTPVARLVVADHGPGMSPDAAARVFERFYRVDAARNRNDGGSGLGLAIVSAIVAGHGGRVHVETAPGAGARFIVELPVTSGAGSVPAAAEPV